MHLYSDHMNHGFGGTGGCWGTQLIPNHPFISGSQMASITREAGARNLRIISSSPHYYCFRGKNLSYHI